MATTAQIQAFTNEYSQSASLDSQLLGIPPQDILGQWGMETDYATQPNMGQNNPGNIMDANGTPVNFANSNQFNQEYVTTVENDFPAFGGHSYSNWNPNLTNQQNLEQAFNGQQSYDPGVSNYGDLINNGVKGLSGQPGGTPATGSSPSQANPVPASSSTPNPYTGFAGAIDALYQFENSPTKIGPLISMGSGFHRFLIICAGLIIMFIGFASFGLGHSKEIATIGAALA